MIRRQTAHRSSGSLDRPVRIRSCIRDSSPSRAFRGNAAPAASAWAWVLLPAQSRLSRPRRAADKSSHSRLDCRDPRAPRRHATAPIRTVMLASQRRSPTAPASRATSPIRNLVCRLFRGLPIVGSWLTRRPQRTIRFPIFRDRELGHGSIRVVLGAKHTARISGRCDSATELRVPRFAAASAGYSPPVCWSHGGECGEC